MGIFLSQWHQPNLQEFIDYYCELVETRLLMDITIQPNGRMYEKFRKIYSTVRQMKAYPYRFLDYCFTISDGFPFPERMDVFLRSYVEVPGIHYYQETIYERVDRDIQYIKDDTDDLDYIYVTGNICPFLPCFDDRVKYYIYHNCLPETWQAFDDDLVYLNKVKVAMNRIDLFTRLRTKLIKDWVPVLEQRRKV